MSKSQELSFRACTFASRNDLSRWGHGTEDNLSVPIEPGLICMIDSPLAILLRIQHRPFEVIVNNSDTLSKTKCDAALPIVSRASDIHKLHTGAL